MFLLNLFENTLPEGATTGIAFSGIAVLGAILVFVLVRISTYLKTSGSLQVELTPLTDLGFQEIRLQAKFFNSSRQDFHFSGFGLYVKKGHYELLAPLSDAPIETGGSHGKWDYPNATLSLPGSASYFGIFHFRAASPRGTYYLGFKNEKGKMEYHSFAR